MTSRREFLKKAGLLTAAFTVPTLNTQGETTQSRLSLKNTKIAVDDRWDVIVVGGGPGGCAAPYTAHTGLPLSRQHAKGPRLY